MYRFKSYKCGDIYKYTATKVVERKKFGFLFDNLLTNSQNMFNHNKIDKSFNNVVRAKTNIKDLILCNDFKYFITLTCANDYHNKNIDELKTIINNKIRKIRQKYKKDFHFILVPEHHKDGKIHFHGVLNDDFSPFIKYNVYDHRSITIFDFLGFSNVSTIGDKNKVACYITKYITKDFENAEKNKHLYFSSHGLKRPQIIEDFNYDNLYFNIKFFNNSNDFKVKYDKELKYYGFILT